MLDVLANLRDTFNLACVLSSEEARTSVSLADHWEVGRERSSRLNLGRQVSFLFLHATVQVLSTYLLVVLAQARRKVLVLWRELALDGMIRIFITCISLTIERLTLLVGRAGRYSLESLWDETRARCDAKEAWVLSTKSHIHHLLSATMLLFLESSKLIKLCIGAGPVGHVCFSSSQSHRS